MPSTGCQGSSSSRLPAASCQLQIPYNTYDTMRKQHHLKLHVCIFLPIAPSRLSIHLGRSIQRIAFLLSCSSIPLPTLAKTCRRELLSCPASTDQSTVGYTLTCDHSFAKPLLVCGIINPGHQTAPSSWPQRPKLPIRVPGSPVLRVPLAVAAASAHPQPPVFHSPRVDGSMFWNNDVARVPPHDAP